MRELCWYRYFVHNRTKLGSLFTLIHVPFTLEFLALVIIGTLPLRVVDGTVLLLSLLVVFLLLYGEHMLDDMTTVGKPWETVFSDLFLWTAGYTILFFTPIALGAYLDTVYHSLVPMLVIGIGAVFCVLYGAEVWKFHSMEFGALGMAHIPPASYLAQTMVIGGKADPAMAIILGIMGFALGYVMLNLYEHTKTQEYEKYWIALAFNFIVVYTIAGIILIIKVTV